MPDSPVPSSELASRRMKNTPTRDTPAELAIRRLLHSMGLRYRVDVRADPALRRRADVVFSRAKVAVFVDGCFWHACPDHGTSPKSNAAWWEEKLRTNVARDRDTDQRLRSAGWAVVRVWEHEDPASAAAAIAEVVAARKGTG